MPKINVYLPDDLAAAVKDNAIPVSSVCQRALEQAVRTATSLRGTSTAEARQGPDAPDRMTRRARDAITAATRIADARDAQPTSVDVLLGILDEGSNLAVVVLESLDIEPDDLRHELLALQRQPASTGDSQVPALLARATDAALAIGHNYVGCEHLLLAILAGESDDTAVRVLNGMGVESVSATRAVRSALAGFFHSRSNSPFGTFSTLGAGLTSALEDIRSRLSHLESR
jgi:ATP-dependent Clp protease ATP-binding subunit ClpA